MPGSEADRIAKEQVKRQQLAEDAAKRAADAQIRLNKQELLQRVPGVLHWLAEHNYPGLVALEVPSNNPMKRLFGINETKGGWRIATRPWTGYHDAMGDYDVYLVSDGRIFDAYPSLHSAKPPHDLPENEFSDLLVGLRALCPEMG